MRAVLSVVSLCLLVLAFPLASSAGGWAGSPYEKSDCTYTKETKSLFCERTDTTERATTEQLAFADESCPSGTRLVSRTGTFVEVWRHFDTFEGHTPNAKRMLFGNDVPLLDQWHWKPGFTDTPLGCL